MKHRQLVYLILFILTSTVSGEFKKNVFIIDSTKYTHITASCLIGPSYEKDYTVSTICPAFRKRGTNTILLFSITGTQLASVTLPDTNFSSILFTQTFVDADLDWEFIVSTQIVDSYPLLQVFDSDGSLLLEDSGRAQLYFDGANTFLWLLLDNKEGYTTWTLRSNISPTSTPGLSKKSSVISPKMVFDFSGNYNITLQPAGSGKTSVQLFDFLGREIFQKTIINITEPVTFSIPGRKLPKTPFLTKLKQGNTEFTKTEIKIH